MSRPQKMHKPIKANFNNVLAAIGAGIGKGKQAAIKAGESTVRESYPVHGKGAADSPQKPKSR